MSITENDIRRINELYHKDKREGLNEIEKIEQKKLREKYIKSIRENLKMNLSRIRIKEKDGSLTNPGDKHEKK